MPDTNLTQKSIRGGETPRTITPRSDSLSSALFLLRQALHTGEHDPLPEELRSSAEMQEILQYIAGIQSCITGLAKGDVRFPISLPGYTGNIIRDLQTHMRMVVLQARRFSNGDFSSDSIEMGEVSQVFDVMGKALQAAVSSMEQQKQDLVKVSENLQREIDARIAVEENLRCEQVRLQKLASTDPLTGIANRRHFFQLAGRELERIRRTGSIASLAMLDIDYFKDLNDALGHSAGDKTLQYLAQLISKSIRPYDIVGRYGGDEFIFLFPETPSHGAHALLERLRHAVEKEKINAGEGNPSITVSIGITEIQGDDSTGSNALDQAIVRADEALYKAKAKSRNRISIS